MRLNFVWYFSYFNDDSKVLCEKERDEHKNSSLSYCISKPIDFKFEMWYTIIK